MPNDPSTDAALPPTRRYLRIQELAPLRNALFASRRPVRGVYAGRHASRQRGHCAEFNDYREYTPGDEASDIDWKVFGRSDRMFIKLFEHQTDMTVTLLVDASASMGFAGVDGSHTRSDKNDQLADTPRDPTALIHPSKYDYACLMAGAIAFLTVRQQDRIGFAAAQQGLHTCLPPRGGFSHLDQLLRLMEQMNPADRAHLPEALHGLAAQRTGRRGLLVVLSDLHEDRGEILDELGAFTSVGGEAVVFHVLHAEEWRLPDLAQAVFIDSETGRRVRVDTQELRADYEQQVRGATEAWRSALNARGIDYRPVSTATVYHQALSDYLFTRSGVM